jgi:2-polyprenyl-6-methoxyphenol hydroxylase-like FAD-dependent oxidoreductase
VLLARCRLVASSSESSSIYRLSRASNVKLDMSNPPNIAIIGAGLAGLTLASVLQRRGIKADLYERDASPTARFQGGTLDLHPLTGQEALRIAGLYDEFHKLMRPEGQDTRIMDEQAHAYMDHIAEEGDMSRPEIDRGPLRQIFIDYLEEIKWGHHLTSISKAQGGGYDLVFNSGESKHYNVVVGADGMASRVRPLVTDKKPKYLDVAFIETYITDVKTRHPECSKFVGRGGMYAFSLNQVLMAQQNGDGRLRIYCALKRHDEKWASSGELPLDDPSATRQKLLELYATWAPEFNALIQATDDSFRVWPMYALPVGINWPHVPGVTTIGDAAHIMSPFAGEGANLAMIDGAKLGIAIAEGVASGDIDGSIAEFEKEMFSRAEGPARESARNLDIAFREDGAKAFVDLIMAEMSGQRPE